MKKLLSILASVTLVASSASTVLACSDNSNQKVIPEDTKTKEIRNESVDAVKQYVLADQYGLDLDATKTAIGNDTDTKTTNFSNPDASVVGGLNLNGTIGKPNKGIYDLINNINTNIVSKLGGSPINPSSVLDPWGKIIQHVPELITASRVNDVFSLVPQILKVVNNLDLLPQIAAGESISDIVKIIAQVVGSLDFNSVISQMVGQKAESLQDIQAAGIKELEFAVNKILFRSVKGDDFTGPADNKFSKWLGQNVLTPLLNKDPDSNKKIQDALGKIFSLENIPYLLMPDLAKSLLIFMASVAATFTVYYPMLVDNPTDQDHLFGDDKTNEDVFQDYDTRMFRLDDNKALTFDNKPVNISLDNTIFKTIDLLTNQDEKSFGIVKITNILFHDNGNGGYLNELVHWVVDALKFTNYRIVVKTTIENIPVLKTINLDIDFALSDLFKPGTPISIKTSVATVNVIIKNNGLNDLVDSIFAPLLFTILSGKDIPKSDPVQAILKPLWNDNKQSVFIDGGFLVKMALNGSLAWKPIWDKIGPLFEHNMVMNAWYKNLDENLTPLGIDTSGMKDIFPLVKTVTDKLSNVNILGFNFDFVNVDKWFSFDTLVDVLKDVFIENEIQIDKDKHDSLFQQIWPYISITRDDDKLNPNWSDDWATELGFASNDEIAAVKGDTDYTYIKAHSVLGKILVSAYKGFQDPKNADVILGDKDNQIINVLKCDLEDSTAATYFNTMLQNFSKSLKPIKLDSIVKPLVVNAKNSVWTTENIINSYFRNSDDIQFESYDLVFNSSSMTVKDADGNILPIHKGRYRIWFSRIDNKSPFEFKKIEKIN